MSNGIDINNTTCEARPGASTTGKSMNNLEKVIEQQAIEIKELRQEKDFWKIQAEEAHAISELANQESQHKWDIVNDFKIAVKGKDVPKILECAMRMNSFDPSQLTLKNKPSSFLDHQPVVKKPLSDSSPRRLPAPQTNNLHTTV